MLLIKYVTPRDRARSLAQSRFKRIISCVDVVRWDVDPMALDLMRANRSSWVPLMEGVRVSISRPDWQTTFEQAIDWFLDQQEVELRAREYPFVRLPDGGATRVLLRYDRHRDQARIEDHRTGLFALYASSTVRRPSFGDFFSALRSDDDSTALEYRADDRGRPAWGTHRRAYFLERLDDDTICIKCPEGAHWVPDKGWLRPDGDFATQSALYRQRQARPELFEARALLAQLHTPFAIRGLQHRWREAGRGLGGGADAVVREMLASQAFYALHGPPGTGKTTVTAHAVAAFLKAEPGARVLIAAQSNFALDNLALRVRKQLKAQGLEVLDLRVRSPSAEDKVHSDLLENCDLNRVTAREGQRIVSRCEGLLRGQQAPEVTAILGEWKGAVSQSLVELRNRLRRGASLVYATCLTATPENVDAVGSFGTYDWVIVEEAAKAWPTELAVPLVRGTRWTLVGDYKQLPAHKQDEVLRLLAECASAQDPDLRAHGARLEQYRRVFSLFGSLFEEAAAAPAPAHPARVRIDKPLGYLKRQFRMRPPIAEVVSRAFYPVPGKVGEDGLPLGGLETDPSTEVDSGLRDPAWLRGRALVWIDTTGIDECANEGCWHNRGEAHFVAEILRQMKPSPLDLPAEPDVKPLAILTPYREQMAEIRAQHLPEGCSQYVFSVHELQGQQANIIVASLVRDKALGRTPRRNLGHLAQPELVNVLFSRARRLLVVIGNFKHFHESRIRFWEVVCELVRGQSAVLSARDVGLLGGGD